MNRGTLIRLALCALLAAPAFAQNALEIIPLRHRTVDQVLPTLQPLLEPGATLSGQGSQLIVRTSPANLAEIRRALQVVDQPSRRLQISVRFDDSLDAASRDIAASGRIGSHSNKLEIRAQDSSANATERVDQRVQVLEGARATIYTGQSRPLRQRQFIQTPGGVVSQEVTMVQELATGFEVVPHLSGTTVFIDILSSRETRPGSASIATTVSGPLGQWFELGAVAQNAARDDRGIASASRSSSSETRRAWVKVEELSN